jgi:hypothetical protein
VTIGTAADPFGTAELRRRVLDGWAASPARFREDANAEEDAALGAYRDRLVVELLQNAADAAQAAAPPPDGDEPAAQGPRGTRVLLRLTDDELIAANTGVPLSAAGVEAASTLRASAKRTGGGIGRFGVGFAAVLAVTDEPRIRSRTGGVRWSRSESAALAARAPALADELARRAHDVPVLRLPFALEPDVRDGPDGLDGLEQREEEEPGERDGRGGSGAVRYDTARYDTLVRLPLRDAAAHALARRLLTEIDPTLPLVLPGLDEVVVEVGDTVRTLRCRWDGMDALLDGRRWHGVASTGLVPAELLADRPGEERLRTAYEIRAFVPDPVETAGGTLSAGGGDGWPADVPRVLRAPQPTDEPLSLPVLLSVPVPLAPSRRHTEPGPLRDWLVERAADAVAALVERLGALPGADARPPGATLAPVPTGLPIGEVDGQLRAAVARRLPDTRLLPGARRGRDCVVLDGALPADQLVPLLAGTLPSLLPAAYTAPRWTAALELLGVTRLSTAALVDLLRTVAAPPGWWGRVYAVMSRVADRDALGALPIPLADGRTATGPRGLLLPAPDLDVTALVAAGLPLRVVEPAACAGPAGDALRALGAVDGTPRGILGDPAVRAAVEDADPADDTLAPAVLALAGAAGLASGELPWLADLLLPDETGEPAPAGELLLPGGPLDRVVADDAPFGRLAAEVAERWPAEVLEAVGVLRTFSVLRAEDVLLDPDEPVLLELDGSDEWAEQASAEAGDAAETGTETGTETRPGEPVVLNVFAAVRDLELVADDRWPAALAELGGPLLRSVVLGPEPAYTRWWLSRNALLPVEDGGALPPTEVCLPAAEPALARLYARLAPLPGVDEDLLRALGARTRLADVLADPDATADLLDRLGDAERDVPWPDARELYLAAAAALAEADADLDPPLSVRTPLGVLPAERVAVADAPDLLPLLSGRAPLRVPLVAAAAVAWALGLPQASELAAYAVVSTGTEHAAPDGSPYREHDRLLVADVDGRPTPVPWRVVDGVAHVDAGAGPDGLARALAWRAGRWADRYALAAALRDPAGTAARQAEDELDER